MRPEPWAVKRTASGDWIVIRVDENGKKKFARRQYTHRGARIIEGFWDRFPDADRARIRLDRKYTHHCAYGYTRVPLTLASCYQHGKAHVVRTGAPGQPWAAFDDTTSCLGTYPTHAEAFAAALASAREATC